MVRTIGLAPLVDVSAVPTQMTWEGFEQDKLVLARFLRIYWPRSYQQILDTYDVIYSAASSGPLGFQPAWSLWFRDAVVEEGLGFGETGGSGSFGGQKQFPGWIGTPMETIPKAPFEWINQGGIKPGATTVIVRDAYPDWPVYAHIEVGKGRTVGWLPFVYTVGGYFGNFAYWEYFPDFLINFIYFTAGVEMPDDPLTVHRIRTILQEFDARRQFLIDIIEFASMFGASSAPLERLVAESSEYEAAIRDLYVEQRYEETWSIAEEARVRLAELEIEAMKLKEDALLWVYVIEWVMVTATALTSGSVLWLLMVRKRVYREVHETRLGRR
jgi:hypothetical protein